MRTLFMLDPYNNRRLNVTYKIVVTTSVVVAGNGVALGLTDVGVGEALHFVQIVEVTVS